MGLDGLRRAGVLLVLLSAFVSGCHSGNGRPRELLYGEAAAEFKPVPKSLISVGRVLTGTALGRRFALCRPAGVPVDVRVVERIGVFSESLTFADRRNRTLYSCDLALGARSRTEIESARTSQNFYPRTKNSETFSQQSGEKRYERPEMTPHDEKPMTATTTKTKQKETTIMKTKLVKRFRSRMLRAW